MISSPDCVFCKIVRGELPCHKIYEDERTLVFLDIFPVAPGHTLVIPREHHENMFETPADALEAIIAMSKRVAHALKETLTPDGLMVFQLNGAAAGQTVFHYHMHLLPRDEGQPLALHTRVPGQPEQLAALARRIAGVLAS